jgi:hypothetical protein
MAYCGPHAVPFEDWLGWSELSQAAAIAWQRRDRDRCHDCGQHRSDWLTVDEDGESIEVDHNCRPAKIITDYCPSCADLARARKARAEPGDGEFFAWAPND